MKKFVVALLLGSVAFGGGGSQVIAEENQALTRAAPAASEFTVTSGSTIGKSLSLIDIEGFRVSVCAEATRTLSGAGNLRAYLLDERSGEVQRNPALDLAVSASSVKCMVFPDMETMVATGRLIYAADSVTVSAGTTVDVRIRGWKSAR